MAGPNQVQKEKKDEVTFFAQLQTEETQYQQKISSQGAQNDGDNDQSAQPAFETKSFSSLSKDEKKAAKKQHKKEKDIAKFVRGEELHTPLMQKILGDKVKIEGHKITQQELYEKVKDGDCSHMQELDTTLRNRAATEYIAKHPITGTPEDFVKELLKKKDPVTEMMNPLLRMGISQVINSDEVTDAVKEKYKKVDELLNTEIMIATITKRAKESDGYTDEQVLLNQRSQIFIIKSMLSCHIGKFKIKQRDKNLPDGRWPDTVANAFSHCSRVIMTMPGQTGEFNQRTEDQMLGSYYGMAGFKRRVSATHALHRKRRTEAKEAKEMKVNFFNPVSQYGMDVAIGGMGNNGIPDSEGQVRKLKNDGSCGHLYMHLEKGNKDKHSGMLIGFESDSFGTMNQTGHVHNIRATGEFASSFGGQRCDEVGDKYGGREADLSEVNIKAYTEAMTLVDKAITTLLESDSTDTQKALDKIARSVCGTLMNGAQKQELFTTLYAIMGNINAQEDAAKLVGRLGGGWPE